MFNHEVTQQEIYTAFTAFYLARLCQHFQVFLILKRKLSILSAFSLMHIQNIILSARFIYLFYVFWLLNLLVHLASINKAIYILNTQMGDMATDLATSDNLIK